MSSDWTFFTNAVNPSNSSNLNNLNNPLLKAFDIFTKELLLDPVVINDHIDQYGYKKLVVDTNGSNDIIKMPTGPTGPSGPSGPIGPTKYHFLKSRFMTNKKLRQVLIEHYNPYRIYVKGPIPILNNDSFETGLWNIEFSRLR